MKYSLLFLMMTALFSLTAPSVSFAADCVAERFPDRFHTDQMIRSKIQPVLPISKRINKRKTLVLESVSSSRDGCNLTVTFKGKLKRKIRKDPRATVKMTTTMGRDDLCVLEDLRVSSVSISSTPRWVDRWVRNKVNDSIEKQFKGICLDLDS